VNLLRLGSIGGKLDSGLIDRKEAFSFAQPYGFAAAFRGGPFNPFLYSLATMLPYRELSVGGSGGGRECLSVDSRGERFAIGWSTRGSVATGPVPGVGYSVGVYDSASNQSVTFLGPSKYINGSAGTLRVAFSPSGRMLAAAAVNGSNVILFDVDSAFVSDNRTPRLALRYKSSSVPTSLVWSPDAKWLGLSAGTWVLWRLPNGDDPEHCQVEPVPPRLAGEPFVFAPDSDLVAGVGVWPNKIQLYDLPQQTIVAESPKLRKRPEKLAFSADSTQLYAAEGNGTITVWRREPTDSSNLVMLDSAVIGAPIIALDVDRRSQVLLLAARGEKRVDIYAAATSGSTMSVEEFAAKCAADDRMRHSAPNVPQLEANKDIPGLIQAIGYREDDRVLNDAATALGRIGAPAIPALTALLNGQDAGLRGAAVVTLGLIGAPAIRLLIAELNDRNWAVREAAAKALGRIGDPQAMPALTSAMNEQVEEVRKAAAEALSHLDKTRAVHVTFNPPPGWPTPPPGWTPPAGWQPDPSWPQAPSGWQFWVSG
jgi:hypothetical protein